MIYHSTSRVMKNVPLLKVSKNSLPARRPLPNLKFFCFIILDLRKPGVRFSYCATCGYFSVNSCGLEMGNTRRSCQRRQGTHPAESCCRFKQCPDGAFLLRTRRRHSPMRWIRPSYLQCHSCRALGRNGTAVPRLRHESRREHS
jgi:hypothetical protein